MESDRAIRFAVIGVGSIAQEAVLPAFEHASERCQLAALVSSDKEKRTKLGEQYKAEYTADYDELEEVLRAAKVDAAYIALPNTQHREYTERCARCGVHVLCEKPMAMTVSDAEAMIQACDDAKVRLMIAYRLHFEEANLRAIELAKSGRLGELRTYSSVFTQQTSAGDIRTQGYLGGGALYDVGIYCVNAARYLFRDEPEEVYASQVMGRDPRFHGVDETISAILRFPDDRLAQFTASLSAVGVDELRLVGTKGDLRMDPAFSYRRARQHYLTIDHKTTKEDFAVTDQFAPELEHFARCILRGEEPEPSGEEGLADVRVLEAIAKSAQSDAPVRLAPFIRRQRPAKAA